MLRPPQLGDGRKLYEAKSESRKELEPWMPCARGIDFSIEESEENCRKAQVSFLLREDLRMNLYHRETKEYLGSTGLHRCNWEYRIFMIGYWLKTSAAGKGYMTEAVNALTRYAFDVLNATRIEITCNVTNLKSSAIPERLFFPKEGLLKNHDRFASHQIVCRDEFIYARTNLEGLPDLKVSW